MDFFVKMAEWRILLTDARGALEFIISAADTISAAQEMLSAVAVGVHSLKGDVERLKTAAIAHDVELAELSDEVIRVRKLVEVLEGRLRFVAPNG